MVIEDGLATSHATADSAVIYEYGRHGHPGWGQQINADTYSVMGCPHRSCQQILPAEPRLAVEDQR